MGSGRELKKEVNASAICFELPPDNDLRKKLLDFQGQMYQKLDEPCAQTFTLPASARLLSVVMRRSHATRLKDVDDDGKENFATTCNTLAARLHFRMLSAALKLLLSHIHLRSQRREWFVPKPGPWQLSSAKLSGRRIRSDPSVANPFTEEASFG